MKKILIGLTIISILTLTSMAHAGGYGKGYAVYGGFYGPPVFSFIVGNGYSSFGFSFGGYYGYKPYYGYGYSKPYYGYKYSKPYYGKYKSYKYKRPYRYGYGYRYKSYGRGYNRYPGRGYRR